MFLNFFSFQKNKSKDAPWVTVRTSGQEGGGPGGKSILFLLEKDTHSSGLKPGFSLRIAHKGFSW